MITYTQAIYSVAANIANRQIPHTQTYTSGGGGKTIEPRIVENCSDAAGSFDSLLKRTFYAVRVLDEYSTIQDNSQYVNEKPLVCLCKLFCADFRVFRHTMESEIFL